MRLWTFPILGAVAFSLIMPAAANARPRSGDVNADWTGSIFWPTASDDLLDYAFFPKGKAERFWAIGYGTILGSAFAASSPHGPRTRRSSTVSGSDLSNKELSSNDMLNRDSDAIAATGVTDLSGAADPCGSGRATTSADQLIERIAQAIRPNAPQRDILEQLRTALVQAIDRINAACPAAAPATSTERLQAIQDRIWAMRDALLTIRGPFEQLYDSLTGDQDWRLARSEPESREIITGTIATAEARSQMCSERAPGIADWPMRTIGRALQPTEQQRASLEALRMRLAGMAQLIVSSCPTYPLIGPMGRIAAVSDRLDVMLFTVMTMSPALPDFYESLSDKQKAGLNRVIRQFRHSARSGDGF